MPFGQRLQELIDQQGISQSWLAERSGVERSTISRLIRENRNPTTKTLECIAPVLGIEIKVLVTGTDAEDQLTENTDMIRRQDYIAAVQKMVEYESRLKDLEIDLRVSRQLHDKEQEARRHAERLLDQKEQKLDEERTRNDELLKELDRYRRALQVAVADVSSLRAQVKDLGREVKSASSSSRTAAILAGIAALAGAVTVATYLSDQDDRQSDHENQRDEEAPRKTRPTSQRRKRSQP